MKRSNLCKTRKLLAVIIAASMSMNSGMIAMADQEVSKVSIVWESLYFWQDECWLKLKMVNRKIFVKYQLTF